jgi:hypothetical protein
MSNDDDDDQHKKETTLQVIDEMSVNDNGSSSANAADNHTITPPGDGDDISPLLPLLQNHEHLRRRRRVRNVWILVTLAFIFTSIAMTILYFVSPMLIKWRVDKVAGDAKHVKTSVQPLRIRNLRDESVTVDFSLHCQLLEGKRVPWGVRVHVKRIKLKYKGKYIATADIVKDIQVPKGTDSLTISNVTAIITITNDHWFGQFVNGLLMADVVQVEADTVVRLTPDYFFTLPSFGVSVTVPVSGVPLLLRNSTTALVPAFDVVEARKKHLQLRLRGVPVVPGVSFGIDVSSTGELIAMASLKQNGFIYILIPTLNDSLRDILGAHQNSLRVNIKGAPERTSKPLKRMSANIDAILDLPRLAPPNLVSGVRITSVLGGTETTMSNPFNVDIHIVRIESMTITDHDTGHPIATIHDTPIGHTVRAGEKHDQLTVKSGKWKYTGGVRGALKVIKDIRAKGFVVATFSGRVHIRIGQYEMTALPVHSEGIKITY